MMTQDDEQLHQLARAIADGASIDWASTESRAADDTRQIVHELAIIAAISEVHCSTPLSPAQADVKVGTTDNDPHAAGAGSAPSMLGTWGTFRLLEKIGVGAHGEVYRAWDARLDREVALKLLPANVDAAGPGCSIIHEGRLLARVRHANVVTIYGAERIDN